MVLNKAIKRQRMSSRILYRSPYQDCIEEPNAELHVYLTLPRAETYDLDFNVHVHELMLDFSKKRYFPHVALRHGQNAWVCELFTLRRSRMDRSVRNSQSSKYLSDKYLLDISATPVLDSV